MRHAFLWAAAVAVTVAQAPADEIVIGRVPYRNVKIQSIKDDKIGFEFYGRTIYKPLAEITQVQIDGNAELNKAEAYLAKGEADKAIALYTAAKEKAEQDWLRALIDHRLSAARGGGAEPPAATGRPSSPPTAKPAPDSSGQPGPESADGPLASPQAFAALLESEPPHPSTSIQDWSELTDGQKRAAERRHGAQRTLWGNKVRSFRGKKVVWELVFQEVTKIEPAVRQPPRKRPPTVSPGARTPPKYTPPPRPPSRTPAQPRTGPRAFQRQGPPQHWRAGYIVKAVSPAPAADPTSPGRTDRSRSRSRAAQGAVAVLAHVLPVRGKGLEQLRKAELIKVTARIRRDLEPGAPPQTLYLEAAEVESTGKLWDPKAPSTPAKRPPPPTREPTPPRVPKS